LTDSPIPIWRHAGIIALILERCFEYMYVPAVPGEKLPGKMYLGKSISGQGGINSIHPCVPEYSGPCGRILCLSKIQLELPNRRNGANKVDRTIIIGA